MSKSLPLIASATLNLLLVLTIANIYVSDQWFKDWVNTTFTPLFPFLVLTFAVGGGSGLGYLFLQRKHPDQRISSKFPKGRLPKPGILLGSSASSAKNATGTTSGPIPKQVAYAVPPPIVSPRSASGGGKQGIPTLSLSQVKPVTQPSASPSLQVLGRKDQPQQPFPSPSQKPDSQQFTMPQPAPRASTQWSQDTSAQFGTKTDSTKLPFQKTGPTLQSGINSSATQPGLPPTNRSPIPPMGTQTSPVPTQKWQPLQNAPPTSASQQTSGPMKPPLPDPSQKWAPLPGRSIGQQAPPPPTVITSQFSQQPARQGPQSLPSTGPRPGPVPAPPGPFASRPMGPNNLVPRPPYPPQAGPNAPNRPGDLGPIAVPRQFRPEQERSAPPQQGPPRMPLTPPGWSPSSPSPQLRPRPPENQPVQGARPPSADQQSGAHPPETPQRQNEQSLISAISSGSEPSPAGGSEMDWDTALDTILKTLRRDKIRDEQ